MPKTKLLNGFYFSIYLREGQATTMNLVFHTKSTIHTTIRTDVGKIEGKIELHGAPEAFDRKAARFMRHRF